MDAETIGKAFGIDGLDGVDPDDIDVDVNEADEESLGEDIEMAFDASAKASDRREAFIRAVKAALKG